MTLLDTIKAIKIPPFEVTVYQEDERIRVRVLLPVLDVFTKEPNTIDVGFKFHPMMDPQDALKEIVKGAEEVLCHELRENFEFKGERIFNPHKK
jgi:hypothetical protein